MKLIVGIGNVGNQYQNTRHNIGFMVIDYFTQKYNFKLEKIAFNGEFSIIKLNDQKVIFAKPHTFVNNSGFFVEQLVNFYKININDILIIHDDKDMEFLKTRLKKNSSSGGHNGIKDIIEKLKTNNFYRFKIGIGKPKIPQMTTSSFVLGKFNDDELKMINSKMIIFEKEIIQFILNEKK